MWQQFTRLLPAEHTVYLADQAFCPYGPRAAAEIASRAEAITRFLLQKKCKLIVVACNTATAAAIAHLRERFTETAFVGMEPAVKPAAKLTRTGHIGLLATAGTLKGDLLEKTSRMHASHVQVHRQEGTGLVELVERGLQDSPRAVALLASYLRPMLQAGADQLVLGCTHYSFLINSIIKVAGTQLNIIDPAPAVAQRAKDLLQQQNLLHSNTGGPGRHQLFSTLGADALQRFVESLSQLPAGSSCSFARQAI